MPGILKDTTDTIYLICSKDEYNNIKEHCIKKTITYIPNDLYWVIHKLLEPRKEYYLGLLNSNSTGPNTTKFWKENWHDKLVDNISTLTGSSQDDVSICISAYFGY